MSETKQLGKITAILADLGLEVTYAYDDLVFIQHSAFLMQFTDDPTTLNLYANEECNEDEAVEIVDTLVTAFAKKSFTLIPKGRYALKQMPDNTIRLNYF